MNEQEMIAWGREEDMVRKREIGAVTDAALLAIAQRSAKSRRMAVGLSASDAVLAIRMARAEDRGREVK